MIDDIDETDGYDIIGDIHGYASKLRALLHKMEYSKDPGGWTHPRRRAIFASWKCFQSLAPTKERIEA